jgi:hemerythrin
MRKELGTWTPYVLLEIPELDDDHQRLLRKVNALLTAVAAKELAPVQAALAALRSETESHFAREEALMREARYPDLKQHCARHQRLLAELRALRFTLDASGMLRFPIAPLGYIRRWFAAHIARDDRRVAAYMDAQENRFLFGLA